LQAGRKSTFSTRFRTTFDSRFALADKLLEAKIGAAMA
jgi:hypothetical protein